MAWGSSAPIDMGELVAKAATTGELAILPFRKLSDADWAALAAALAASPAVTSLQATGRPIGPEGARAMGRLLCAQPTTLRHLSLGDATFADAGCLGALLDGMGPAGAPCTLDGLDLSLKGLSAGLSSELAELLRRCPQLRALDLSRNELGDAIASLRLPVLGATLTTLDLSGCGLTAGSLSALVGGGENQLGDLRVIETLRLSRANLRDATAEHLTPLLAHASLTTLHLEECALQAQPLADALAAAALLTPLRELRLCGNDGLMGDEGGVALATRLGAPPLTALGLGSTGFDDVAAEALARAAHDSPHLAEVDAPSNELTADGAAALLRLRGLSRLSLAGNRRLGDVGGAAIAAVIAEHVGRDPPMPLHGLDLGACAMEAPPTALSAALGGGGAPALRTLELFGNGTQHAGAWREVLTGLHAERPQIDVAWRAPAGVGGGGGDDEVVIDYDAR